MSKRKPTQCFVWKWELLVKTHNNGGGLICGVVAFFRNTSKDKKQSNFLHLTQTHPMDYPEYWPTFLTATNLNWLPLMQPDSYKQIIVYSLAFLVKSKRVKVYAFVIINHHFHLIWQVLPGHTPEAVQRDFLKYTGQQMKSDLQKTNPSF